MTAVWQYIGGMEHDVLAHVLHTAEYSGDVITLILDNGYKNNIKGLVV